MVPTFIVAIAAPRFVAMSTVQEIVQYLKGCTDFFKSQDGLLSEDLRQESVKSMAATIVRNIISLTALDAGGASALNKAISASTFPEPEKTAFATAVVQRLTAPAAEGGGDDSTKQVMTAPYNFPTESDWRYIRDQGKSMQQVCVRVRERFRLLGLNKISEKTYAALASMIAAAREPDMSQRQLKSVVDDLKQAVVANDVPPIHLHTFPTSPTDLPEALYKRAYGEERPCPQEFPEYKTIVKRCPCRSSHKSLRPSPSPDARGGGRGPSAANSATSASASLEPMARAMMPLFEGVMANFANQIIGPGRRIVFDGNAPGGDNPTNLRICAGEETRMEVRKGDSLVPKDPRLGRDSTDTTEHATPEHQLVASAGEDLQVTPHVDEEDDKDLRSPVDVVAEMERIARGEGGAGKPVIKPEHAMKKPSKSTGLLKRPSAPIPSPSAKHLKQAILRKPASTGSKVLKKSTKSTSSKALLLGCARCRGSTIGCLSCRDPNFKGTRFQKR